MASYYPPALSFGGPPRVMFDLGKELLAKGHSIAAYTTDIMSVEDWRARIEKQDEVTDGIAVHRFRRVRFSDRLLTKFLKLWAGGVGMEYARNAGNFDIVHVADITHPLALQCTSRASRAKVPYVVSIFGNLSPSKHLPERVLRGTFDLLWGGRMLKNAAALLVQTPHEAELCSQYTSEDRIVPMHLPIDMGQFQHLPARGRFREKYNLGQTDKVVLFLGRLHEYKGVQLLVAAVAGLPEKHGLRLVVAGSDEGYRATLERQIKSLGIENRVLFTGPIFGEDKLEAYLDADVFVTTPVTYEETSLAALEACACGTPVIVTERNAIPGLVEHEAGFQIHYDKEELAGALLKILDSSALKEKMGRNARRLIEQEYALDKVVGRLEGLFLSILQRGNSQSEG
ncbi:MAG: glycosyltransferase [Chloroflexota bacterium]